jgi:hypothetical protein
MQRQSRCDASYWRREAKDYQRRAAIDSIRRTPSFLYRVIVNGFSSCTRRGCGSFVTSKHRGLPVRHLMSNFD